MDVLALVAGGLGLLLVAVLVLRRRSRRSSVRRIVGLAARLGDEGLELEGRGSLERSLSRLERAVDGAMGTIQDARLSAERLERVLGQLPQGVMVSDEQGQVVYRNQAATEALSGEGADALAQEAVHRLLGGALEGQTGAETIEVYGPPRRTLTIRAAALETTWRGVGAVAVIEDATESHKVEASRRDFVANISHELKTPLGALGLLAETLAVEDDAAVVARLAKRIQVEAQRVAKVMDDLLDLSRIESEEAPTREPVPVHLVVAQAAERVRSAAEQRGVRIRIGEPPHHLTVLGDRRQLISALYNLMENAVKYSERGTAIEVGGRTDGQWVELRVRDHGIGIPAHDQERIFERFYRVDRARGRDGGGTGLGLAIVRHVATNHGGEVSVESEEGEGSTFTLRLPTGPAAAVSRPAKAG